MKYADGEADYRAALDAALQWSETWRLTGDPRHLDAAMACSHIAMERFAELRRQHTPGRKYAELEHLEREAEHEAISEQIRENLAETQRLLARLIKIGKAS